MGLETFPSIQTQEFCLQRNSHLSLACHLETLWDVIPVARQQSRQFHICFPILHVMHDAEPPFKTS
jgi:hypothetical protein